MNISLAERDNYLYQIEKQIQAKRKLILKKKKILKKKENQNEFLLAVKEEYNSYFENIIKETMDEYLAMKTIADHIENIIEDGIKKETMSKEDLKHAKKEHKEVVEEINKIKRILDQILKD
jgi:ribosome-binding protein aMBF1 (putative translation factor)